MPARFAPLERRRLDRRINRLAATDRPRSRHDLSPFARAIVAPFCGAMIAALAAFATDAAWVLATLALPLVLVARRGA